MADMPRRHRLSRRGRRPILQRAPSLRPRRGRRATDGPDRRDFPQGRADRRACARQRQPQAHHRPRDTPSSHRRYAAGRSSVSAPTRALIGAATAALCELILEARPHPEQGFRACSGHRPARGSPWRRAPRSSPPNAPSTSAPGPTARSNPSSTTTLTGVPRASAPRTERRSYTPTSGGRATTIRRNDLPNIPPSINSALLACMAWLRPFAELVANGEAGGLGHHEWLGLLLDREASWRTGRQQARGAAARRQTAPTGQRRRCRLSLSPRS